MENASKALIIAGTILIAIVLIGLGMMFFNRMGGIINLRTSSMSSQETAAFNGLFEKYIGEQKGTAVNELIYTIATNNEQQEESRHIEWQCLYDAKVIFLDDVLSEKNYINTGRTYNVEFTYDVQTGLIIKAEATFAYN